MSFRSNTFRFARAQVSSVLSSIVDFSFYALLHYLFQVWYVAASVSGVIAGGITNYMIGRIWVFDGRKKPVQAQVLRYSLVWFGNLLLNAIGVYLLRESLGLDPTISKITTAILIGFTYNYQLQKKFVFK